MSDDELTLAKLDAIIKSFDAEEPKCACCDKPWPMLLGMQVKTVAMPPGIKAAFYGNGEVVYLTESDRIFHIPRHVRLS